MKNRPWIVIACIELLVIVYLLTNATASDAAPRQTPTGATGERTAAVPRSTDASTGGETEPLPAERRQLRTVVDREPVREIPGTTLVGRVVDAATGESVSDGMIHLRPVDTESWLTVGLDGRPFALAGLNPGPYEAWIRRVTGYEEVHREVEIIETPLQEIRLAIGSAAVLYVGTQTPDGTPLRAALAASGSRPGASKVTFVATREQPPPAFAETELRHVQDVGCGRFQSRAFGRRGDVPERFDGVLEIEGGLPVFVSVVHRHVVLATELVEPGTTELMFTVPVARFESSEATVRMRVLAAESGAPLTDVAVSLSDRQSGGRGQRPGPDGRVELQRVPPGLLELVIRGGTEREVLSYFVRVPPGEVLDLGDVRVDPGVDVQGVVVGPDGQPRAGISLRWTRVDRHLDGAPLQNGMSAESDTEGRFRLWGCGRGRFLVTAVGSDGLAVRQTIDTTAGALTDLRLTLASTTKLTLAPDSRMPDRVRASFRNASGITVATVSCQPGVNRSFGLAPGQYVVSVYRGATLLRELPLQLGAEPVTIQLP